MFLKLAYCDVKNCYLKNFRGSSPNTTGGLTAPQTPTWFWLSQLGWNPGFNTAYSLKLFFADHQGRSPAKWDLKPEQ